MEEERPPGLRYDGDRPMWRATKAAVKARYPVKSVNLASLADNPRLLRDRCIKLQREMLEWISNGERRPIQFDGTFRSLFDLYETDPKSPFHKHKYSTRKPYSVYLRMMRAEIGHCRIDRTDGRDVQTWFDFWATGENGTRHVAKARMAIAILKAAFTFGVLCRKPGCADFKAVLSATRFEGLPPREAVITFDQVVAARAAAHAAGHPLAALCYALQFETTARQVDLAGQWLPLSEPQPSSVIEGGRKWIGAHWSNIDSNLILRLTPTKTERTTGQKIVADLRACSMVMEELARIAPADRTGPLIVNRKTGFPYTATVFIDLWHAVSKKAGIPRDVWNRDLRASGATEAKEASARTDDLQKLMGHRPGSKTTATVYDRAALDAHRRVAQARTTHREKK
jgi:hypothetical protein